MTSNDIVVNNIDDEDVLDELMESLESDSKEENNVSKNVIEKETNDIQNNVDESKIIDDAQLQNSVNELMEKLQEIDDNNEIKMDEPKEDVKPTKKLPKKYMMNQKKYFETLEKQKRMEKKNVTKNTPLQKKTQTINLPQTNGMRRIIVAGKVKYIPINNSVTSKVIEKKEIIPPKIIHIPKPKNDKGSGKKLPPRYAKQIENGIKKETLKNAKNFTDLLRIKALENIVVDSSTNTSQATISELRKLRTEQKRREFEQKKNSETNQRESAIQDILKNDKLSKFAKTVAIKNLSVNSRNGKKN